MIPNMEYCSYVWNAELKNKLDLLDSLQRHAVRTIGESVYRYKVNAKRIPDTFVPNSLNLMTTNTFNPSSS